MVLVCSSCCGGCGGIAGVGCVGGGSGSVKTCTAVGVYIAADLLARWKEDGESEFGTVQVSLPDMAEGCSRSQVY